MQPKSQLAHLILNYFEVDNNTVVILCRACAQKHVYIILLGLRTNVIVAIMLLFAHSQCSSLEM